MHSWIKKEKKKKGTFFEKSTCKDRWRENKWFSFTGKIEKSFEKRVLRFSLRETIISRKIPAWIRFKLARSSKIFTGRIHAQTSEWRVRKKKKKGKGKFLFPSSNDDSREDGSLRVRNCGSLIEAEISNFSSFPDNYPSVSSSRILSSVPSDSSP